MLTKRLILRWSKHIGILEESLLKRNKKEKREPDMVFIL